MAGIRWSFVGIVLGLGFVLLVHSVPPQLARQLIALSLAVTACVYCGALLAQSVPGHVVVLELAVFGVVFACAVVGLGVAVIGATRGCRLIVLRPLLEDVGQRYAWEGRW